MSLLSSILVHDPVDPHELFLTALRAVGLSPQARWNLRTIEDVQMLQARPDQGAQARVTVQFAPDGAPYPDHDEPPSYALVSLNTSSGVDRAYHDALVDPIGQWLSEQDLRWSWSYEGGPWTQGRTEPQP